LIVLAGFSQTHQKSLVPSTAPSSPVAISPASFCAFINSPMRDAFCRVVLRDGVCIVHGVNRRSCAIVERIPRRLELAIEVLPPHLRVVTLETGFNGSA
jgi:hypothetical protein